MLLHLFLFRTLRNQVPAGSLECRSFLVASSPRRLQAFSGLPIGARITTYCGTVRKSAPGTALLGCNQGGARLNLKKPADTSYANHGVPGA